MATNEEILNIILAIQAQGVAEAEAVNQVLAQTGNTALGTAGQVQVLNQKHEEHASAAAKAAAGEREVSAEANAAARAMGALGDSGAKAFERISALGALAGAGGIGGIGIAATLVAAGAIVEGGKSMIENADHNEEAQRNLSSAFADQGKALQNHQGEIDSWLDKNRRFISDQYEAKDSIATIVRAGNDWVTTQRIMNDALDLSAAKHISLTDATKVLVDAEAGRALGLVDLGISIKKIDDPQKEITKATKEIGLETEKHTRAVRELTIWEDNHHDRSVLTAADLIHEQILKDAVATETAKLSDANQSLATAEQLAQDKGSQFNQVLDQVEGKVKGDRGDISDLTKSWNDLKNSWDDLSNTQGPALEEELSHIIDYINHHGIPAVDQLLAGFQQLVVDPFNAETGPNSPAATDPLYRNEINAWLKAHGFQAPPPGSPGSDWQMVNGQMLYVGPGSAYIAAAGRSDNAEAAADKKAQLDLLRQIAQNTRNSKGNTTYYVGSDSTAIARNAARLARELGTT